MSRSRSQKDFYRNFMLPLATTARANDAYLGPLLVLFMKKASTLNIAVHFNLLNDGFIRSLACNIKESCFARHLLLGAY